MACPFFLPNSPLTGFSDVYSGRCAAGDSISISHDLLEHGCNNGYARETCVHASRSESDVFRFLVKAHCNGIIEVAWSSERNHHPVAVGSLSIDQTIEPDTPLERQAWISARNYLTHIGQAS